MSNENKDYYKVCCSEDESKLAYPRFSAVFLQTFCIHDALEFVVPQSAVLSPKKYQKAIDAIDKAAQNAARAEADKMGLEEVEEGWKYQSLAEYKKMPIVYMYQDIERQIFIDPSSVDVNLEDEREKERLRLNEKKLKKTLFYNESVVQQAMKVIDGHPYSNKFWFTKKTLAPYSEDSKDKVYTFSNKSVYRFSLRGFEFSVPIEFEKDKHGKYKVDPITLKGHANVEMSLFYGNTVSIAYKFYFDGYTAFINSPDGDEKVEALTDHIIAFLSCHLGAEFWSENKKLNEANQNSNINFFQKFIVDKIWIDKYGKSTTKHQSINSGDASNQKYMAEKRVFNDVMLRYKRYLYSECTAYKEKLTRKEKLEHEVYRAKRPLSVSLDHHYAMVDIWGDVKHVEKTGNDDVFSETHEFELSEKDIVDHIRDFHKPELIGLMTLYPSEWKYRDPQSYDLVCGESMAIDTDDLVLVGSHVSVVVGTYDRRGSESEGNDWKAMAKVKAKYQVAWPEFLLILQFVLAKKVVIGCMKDRMIYLIGKMMGNDVDISTDELLFKNAKFSLDLTRQILQLDIVKYAKFASHRVMYDRTMSRLNVEKDIDDIKSMSEMLNDNLQNISNYRTMKAELGWNMVLILLSGLSLCDLLYKEPEFKFFEGFRIFFTDFKCENIPPFGAWVVAVLAIFVVFGMFVQISRLFRKSSGRKIR